MDPIETAPLYTRAERLRRLTIGAAIGAVVLGLVKLWLLPWFAAFAAAASCDVARQLVHAVLVGVPLLAAVAIGVPFGRIGLGILRERQFPRRGTKVFRPTPIRRGAAAKRIGVLHLVAFVPFVALALWGQVQASALERHATPCVAKAPRAP